MVAKPMEDEIRQPAPEERLCSVRVNVYSYGPPPPGILQISIYGALNVAGDFAFDLGGNNPEDGRIAAKAMRMTLAKMVAMGLCDPEPGEGA